MEAKQKISAIKIWGVRGENGNPVASDKYSPQPHVQMTKPVAATETLLTENKKGI